MTAEKPECMRIAKKFGQEYWDGDRKYGYGGYKYDGRYKPVAEAMIKHYGLPSATKILDIGCGKGFLLFELGAMSIGRPHYRGWGIDTSDYAIDNNKFPYRDMLYNGNCIDLPYADKQFDFTYSINVFHNLGYKDLKSAIKEIVRVSKDKMYICVESYRTEEELCNLQCWALTAKSFYDTDDWKQIYEDCGYAGDYEFIYFN